jgi:hypothetical protein
MSDAKIEPMTDEALRIAVAEFDGWKGCVDVKCDYRKAQHLHKGSAIGFPEPYSTKRYPFYATDLNATHELWGNHIKGNDDLEDEFSVALSIECGCAGADDGGRPNLSDAGIAIVSNASARQRCLAFLRLKGRTV